MGIGCTLLCTKIHFNQRNNGERLVVPPIMETFYCAQFVHIISQCMLMVQSPTQIFFRKNDGTLQFEIKIEYVD